MRRHIDFIVKLLGNIFIVNEKPFSRRMITGERLYLCESVSLVNLPASAAASEAAAASGKMCIRDRSDTIYFNIGKSMSQ